MTAPTLTALPARFVDAKRAVVEAFERDYFTHLHEAAQGNISEMARCAGMERVHLRAYLGRYGIGGRAPTGRPRDADRASLARLTKIIAPRDGETLEEAAARLAAARRAKGTT